jgi:hypothetical protein
MCSRVAILDGKTGKLLEGIHPKHREKRHTPADIGKKKCAEYGRGWANSRGANCETQPEKCDIEEAAEGDIAIIESLLYPKPESAERGDGRCAARECRQEQPRIKCSPITAAPARPDRIPGSDAKQNEETNPEQEWPDQVRCEIISSPKNNVIEEIEKPFA